MPLTIPAQALADAQAVEPDVEMRAVLLAIAGPESSWNARALGDYKLEVPTSFGYLQMHTGGGLGDPYTPAQLLDGRFNLRLGADYIRSRLAAGATLYDALAPWSTRDAALALLPRVRELLGAGAGSVPGPIGPIGDGGVNPLPIIGILLFLVILIRSRR